jgi:hypothetical protein
VCPEVEHLREATLRAFEEVGAGNEPVLDEWGQKLKDGWLPHLPESVTQATNRRPMAGQGSGSGSGVEAQAELHRDCIWGASAEGVDHRFSGGTRGRERFV